MCGHRRNPTLRLGRGLRAPFDTVDGSRTRRTERSVKRSRVNGNRFSVELGRRGSVVISSIFLFEIHRAGRRPSFPCIRFPAGRRSSLVWRPRKHGYVPRRLTVRTRKSIVANTTPVDTSRRDPSARAAGPSECARTQHGRVNGNGKTFGRHVNRGTGRVNVSRNNLSCGPGHVVLVFVVWRQIATGRQRTRGHAICHCPPYVTTTTAAVRPPARPPNRHTTSSADRQSATRHPPPLRRRSYEQPAPHPHPGGVCCRTSIVVVLRRSRAASS